MVRSRRDRRAPLLIAVTAVMVAGCSSAGSLNPFKKADDPPLPGERISILRQDNELTVDERAAQRPLSLPAEQRNEAWAQPGGTASNAPQNLAFSGALRTVWQAGAGAGSSGTGRLVASPIVYQGRVYVLDSEGAVSAFSAAGGTRAWRVSLTPPKERPRVGYGGGLAADGGRIYAVTGFGTAVALDPASGRVLWQRKIGEPIRTSPTAANGKVFFVTSESELYCLNGEDGEEIWKFRGTPEPATLLSNVSPAVAGETVVVPYPSGEIIAYNIANGRPGWIESVSGARRAASSPLASLSDPARPVIEGGVVFATGNAGRLIASSLSTGERLWTQKVGSTQTPWVAGEAVFVVDADNRLVALSRANGSIRWVSELPAAGKWNGPVLAGGRLWLVSSKGLLLGIDPATGQIGPRRDLGLDVFIAPVVAGGRMYVYTDKATLIALD